MTDDQVPADGTGSSSRAHGERLTCDIAPTEATAPSDAFTANDLTAIRAAVEKAQELVGDLAAGSRTWKMTIPVDMNRDSDMILTSALASAMLLLAEVERLRGELTRFEGNAEILSASTVGEAFDRIEQTIRERDEARAELAKARQIPLWLADIISAITDTVENTACNEHHEDGGCDHHAWDQMLANVPHVVKAKVYKATGGVFQFVAPAPSAVEAASTVPADAVTALRDAGILACGTGQTSDDVREGEVAL